MARYLVLVAGQNELEVVVPQKLQEQPQAHDMWNYYEQGSFCFVHTGMGATNAACAAHTFIKHQKPDYVVSLGLSGAHEADLAVGTVVFAQDIVCFSRHIKLADGGLKPLPEFLQFGDIMESIEYFPCNTRWTPKMMGHLREQEIAYEEGTLGGADQFNRDPSFIQRVHEVYGTTCEDMETGAIAAVAARWKVPVLGMRVISNNELSPQERTQPGQAFNPLALRVLKILTRLLVEELSGGA